MPRFFASTAFLALAFPAVANAATVAAGCAVPSLKPGHHTFYIDPVRGSKQGDGSAAKPWRTLSEVLDDSSKLVSTMGHNFRTFPKGDNSLMAINPNGPIKPGDVLMLKSGNHGDIKILNTYNSDFITVMAAPGETPVLTSLGVYSATKWLFQGIKVLGGHPRPGYFDGTVTFGPAWLGDTSDVIIENSRVSASDDTSSWGRTEWETKPTYFLLNLAKGGTCFAANNNEIYNGKNGINLSSNRSIVEGNVIRAMRYDGIDFTGSDLIIRRNTIKDNANVFAGETLHPDGIQGWSLKDPKQNIIENKNDVVDSNIVIKTGDGKATMMQGITVFDGKWDGLKIINNVVVVNTYEGISILGGKNVSVMNNTLLGSDPQFITWMKISKDKSSQPGQNVVVRNNVIQNANITDPGVIFDHNMIIEKVFAKDASNKLFIYNRGVYGDANKFDPQMTKGFVSVNAQTGTYDLRLTHNSSAIGAGTPLDAPKVDITNKMRSTPIDAGAYEH